MQRLMQEHQAPLWATVVLAATANADELTTAGGSTAHGYGHAGCDDHFHINK